MILSERRRGHRALGGLLACLALTASARAVTVEPAPWQRAGTRVIRTGVLVDNPPFSYRDSDGQIKGFAVELVAAIEPVMGLHLERINGATAKINSAFVAGQLDLLQTYATSPEREAYADFSVPYLTMSGAIIVRRGETGIRELGDLRGRKVMVHRGSVGEGILRNAGLADTIVYVDSVEQALRKLAGGEADATLASRLTALATIDVYKLDNITPVGDPVPGYRIWYCFAVRDGDKELLAWLNEGLAILQRTGEFDRIYTKWFGRIEPVGYSREQIVLAVAIGLLVALLVALWAALRQRRLRRRIANQAARLRESEEKFATAFRSSPFSLTISEMATGRYIDANDGFERLSGYTRTDVIGRTSVEMGFWQNPADRDEFVRLLREQGAIRGVELKFLNRRREVVFTRCSSELINLGGKPCSLTALMDITEQRKSEQARADLEQQLRQTQKLEAIGTLASGIAHDFNNILTAINGNAELARMDLPAGDAAQGHLANVIQAAQRAGTLTRQILTFSRKAEPKLESISVSLVLQEVVQLVQSTVRGSVEVRCEQLQATPPIKGDPAQVHQVLLNLCTNAVYAMRGRPGLLNLTEDVFVLTPDLQTQHPQLKPGTYVHVAVRDNGCGIPADVVQRIFEPFYTTKPAGEGTGLGLSVVHGIMQNHGGTVTVYSKPGEGTVFHLYFPVAPQSAAGPDAAASAPVPAGHGQRILFVDDEVAITRAFQRLLGSLGYHFAGFSDPAEALAHFTGDPAAYDLLVTDLAMPGMNGLELARRVRGVRANLPIVFITGYVAESEIATARALGNNELVEKPLTLDSLGRAVHRVLAGARR